MHFFNACIKQRNKSSKMLQLLLQLLLQLRMHLRMPPLLLLLLLHKLLLQLLFLLLQLSPLPSLQQQIPSSYRHKRVRWW